MTSIHGILFFLIPDIILAIAALMGLMAIAWGKPQEQVSYYLLQMSLWGALLSSAYLLTVQLSAHQSVALNGFVFDPLGSALKFFIFLSVFWTFLYARHYNQSRHIPAEFYVLGILSTVGMSLLVSANHVLLLLLGLELLVLPTYAMTALQRSEGRTIEAAMKYFILGGVALAFLLYGLSMIFVTTKTLDFSVMSAFLQGSQVPVLLVFGLVFVIAGVAFKLGTAPFHVWVPDVYDGSPTSVAVFIAAAPKIAAYAMTLRLLGHAMSALHLEWQPILIAVSVLSMAIGNVAAIVQSNIKRLLAYSAIAHMGYLLLGILAGTARGYAASLFYVVSYSVVTLGAFGVILLMSQKLEASTLEDFSGLHERNPWLAGVMLLVMFSLAGVPPLVGFMAKVNLIEALIQVHLVWLAVVTILFSIVGSYYYIRVVKVMYFDPLRAGSPSVFYPWSLKLAIGVNGLAVLLLGVFPNGLIVLSRAVFDSAIWP